MAKITTIVPDYCDCTPAEWEAARESYLRKSQDPAWGTLSQGRLVAVIAQMGSGRVIEPELAMEFEKIIAARNYKPAPGLVRPMQTHAPVGTSAPQFAEYVEDPYARRHPDAIIANPYQPKRQGRYASDPVSEDAR